MSDLTLESLNERVTNLISQFENLKLSLEETYNNNVKASKERFENIAVEIKNLQTAIGMLEGEIKGLKPTPPPKAKATKFSFTLLDLADEV